MINFNEVDVGSKVGTNLSIFKAVDCLVYVMLLNENSVGLSFTTNPKFKG